MITKNGRNSNAGDREFSVKLPMERPTLLGCGDKTFACSPMKALACNAEPETGLSPYYTVSSSGLQSVSLVKLN